MRTLLAVGLLAGSVALADADDKTAPLEGRWVIESLTRDGKDETANYKGGYRENTGGKYKVNTPAGSPVPAAGGSFTVDAGKSPATIDMKPDSGRYKDKTLPGIYKVDGDTLTVAFAEPGKDRPAAFESKPGSGVVLVVHKRVR